MKKLSRFILNLIGVFMAALAGNWAGGQLRALVTGEKGRTMRFLHTDEQGETTVGANVALSSFIPALLAGTLFKPRLLSAFFAGIAASAVLGDRLEGPLEELLDRLAPDG